MTQDRLYLIHIRECIGWIQDDTHAGRDTFLANRTIRDAVLRNLQIMAESTQRLSPEIKVRHSQIPWAQLAGFRNILVHAYLGIRHELVWQFIEHHLPSLATTVNAMLAELNERNP